MKKFLALTMAMAMVLSLAACGGNSGSKSEGSAASAGSASSAGASASASTSEPAALATIEEGKLIMSTNASFPPYEMTDDSGKIVGIDAEIAAKIPCTQVLGTYTVTFDR